MEGFRNDIALLWDVENIDQKGEKIAVVDLIDEIEKRGRIVLRKAYADWYRLPRQAANNFHNNHFELLLVPHEKGVKNSVDIKIAVDMVNIIQDYPTVQNLVLIANDGDYRHVSSSARLRGKQFILICDPQKTNTNLLQMVDEYIPVQQFIADETVDDDKKEEQDILPTQQQSPEEELQQLLDLLVEAINIVSEENQTEQVQHSYVLTRLQTLEPDLQQKLLTNERLNYSAKQKGKWFLSFLRYAEEIELITLEFLNNFYVMELMDDKKSEILKRKKKLHKYAIQTILENEEHGVMTLDHFASKYALLLKNNDVSYYYKDVGYKKLKNLLEDIDDIPISIEKLQNGKWEIIIETNHYKSIKN